MPARITIFTTPILSPLLQQVARLVMFTIRWRVVGPVPEFRRCVLIAAPHTSNWDGILLVVLATRLGLPLHWMGKKALFRFPFRGIMRWFGGIPIDRGAPGGIVETLAGAFREAKHLVLVIPPEGTRSRVERWKTGFYRIADRAQVPVLCGFLDYAKRMGGLGPHFLPSGDLLRDLPILRDFYDDKVGRYPEKFAGVPSEVEQVGNGDRS